jgi:hypothetical protein
MSLSREKTNKPLLNRSILKGKNWDGRNKNPLK